MALRSRTLVKKTKKGQVLKVVAEHYLRDDIWCGSHSCAACKPADRKAEFRLEPAPAQYLVVDTSVIMSQMALLECLDAPGVFSNIVLPLTVRKEVQTRDARIYKRLLSILKERATDYPTWYCFANEHHRSTYSERQPTESPQQHQDRLVRGVARWYAQHLSGVTGGIQVRLLTNDAQVKAAAVAEGVACVTMTEYVAMHEPKHPKLSGLLIKAAEDDADRKERDLARSEFGYTKHVDGAELQKGIDSGKYKTGKFNVNRDYWIEGTVGVRDFDQFVLIPGLELMNRAIDGDVVAIEILPEDQWQAPSSRLPDEVLSEEAGKPGRKSGAAPAAAPAPAAAAASSSGSGKASKKGGKQRVNNNKVRVTGRVVGIVQRNWKAYCGCLEVTEKKTGGVFFIAANKRIPKIKLASRQIENLMDKRILVQIDSWPANSRYPLGHYVRTMGVIGDRDTETAVVLMEHDIPNEPWSETILNSLPPDNYTVPAAEIAKRTDLRNIPIFSIDPPGCTDIDDTLHCIVLPNGNFEVGVHIADVSHFIQPDTPLDREASNRGTSVYLVNKRIDMIPTVLSTNICSLVEKKDRLTFSVVWEMTKDAEIVGTKYFRSVINSCASLAYSDAQHALDLKPEELSNDPDERVRQVGIRNLGHIARILKKRRTDAGALVLASMEVKFLVDKTTQQPTDVTMYQIKEANSLVEEFMLLANIYVGKRCLEYFPGFAMLRRHPMPSAEMLEPLVRAARLAGFEVDTSSSKALADSLDRCDTKSSPYFNKMIRIIATRCMSQAVYFSSGDLDAKDYAHYGLACPVYTHFTSPIRRYADIVVHRQLAASLGIAPLPAAVRDRQRMREMSEVINHRHRMAQMCGRASADLFTLLFFRGKRVEEDALVISVRSNGIRVLVPRYGIESAIRLVSAEEEEALQNQAAPDLSKTYTFSEENMSLSGPLGSFRIFQKLRVVISVTESKLRRQWLTIELATAADAAAGGAKRAKTGDTIVQLKPATAAADAADAKAPRKNKAAADPVDGTASPPAAAAAAAGGSGAAAAASASSGAASGKPTKRAKTASAAAAGKALNAAVTGAVGPEEVVQQGFEADDY